MIRPNVLDMRPYSPGRPIDEVQRELGLDRVIKLASNENPLGPSPLAIEAVQRAAKEMHLYPDASGHLLREALAAKHGIPYDQIVLGNGSDELIHLLGLILLGSEEDELLIGDPSFVRYDAAAQLVPCRLVKVPLDSSYRHDLSAMAKAATDRTRLVFVANPNNPTGTIVSRRDWAAFVRDLPEGVVAVLDEAYFEFASHLPEVPNSLDDVLAGRNVVGLRTFSKTYGLAGIRIGFAFCPPAISDAIRRVREPFSVNSLAQVAALAALKDEEHLSRTVENNRRGLRVIAAAFREQGIEPCESYANFVFADLGRPAGPIIQSLLKRGVIVRGLHVPSWVRVSVGTPEENALFAEALREAIGMEKGA